MRMLPGGIVAMLALAGSAVAQLPPPPPPPPVPGMPMRDAAAPKTGTAALSGTVVSAETGMPLRRALVRAVGSDPRDARTVSTDEKGRWNLEELPAGRYSLQVSKGGYVQLSYGQRRPFEQGRPVELAEGQTIDKLDVALPKGSVIAGRLFDEFGEPVAGARVMAMRYRVAGGVRRLIPFGGAGASALTDDLGQFRLHGLPPGDYYLSATGGAAFMFDRSDDRTGYAPTFYPGTASIGEAQRITVAQGQESLGITFELAMISVATVSGIVTSSVGKPVANGMVMLGPANPATPMITPLVAVTRADGAFTLSNVAPGDYRLQVQMRDVLAIAATGRSEGPAEVALMPLTVSGSDLSNVSVVTSPMATVRGKVTFAGGPLQGLSPSGLSITLMPSDPAGMSTGAVRVRDDWTFEGEAVLGRRLVRVPSTASGWYLKSVTLNGTDVTDTGLDFAPGETVTGIEIELTRNMASVSGGVQGAKGEALTDYIVVVFASDSARWGFQTRFVRTGRPDQSGRFVINDLPAGAYQVVALEYLEPGEEQDPEVLERLRALSTPITLTDGEAQTLSLKTRW